MTFEKVPAIKKSNFFFVRQKQHLFILPWRDSFESLAVLSGDAIVVPTKMKSPNNIMQQLPILSQSFSQTAMTGAVTGTTR